MHTLASHPNPGLAEGFPPTHPSSPMLPGTLMHSLITSWAQRKPACMSLNPDRPPRSRAALPRGCCRSDMDWRGTTLAGSFLSEPWYTCASGCSEYSSPHYGHRVPGRAQTITHGSTRGHKKSPRPSGTGGSGAVHGAHLPAAPLPPFCCSPVTTATTNAETKLLLCREAPATRRTAPSDSLGRQLARLHGLRAPALVKAAALPAGAGDPDLLGMSPCALKAGLLVATLQRTTPCKQREGWAGG